MQIFTPPSYEGLGGNDRVIFLAGPMKGAEAWQMDAAEMIHETDPSIRVASPRRVEGISDTENFERRDQVRWEAHWLARAAYHGSLLFYYAKQDHEVHEEGSEFARAYAKTTGKELYLWWGRKAVQPAIQMVLGADPEFGELGYEHEREAWDLPNIPILNSLEETVQVAIEQTHRARPIANYDYWTPDSPLYVSS